MIYLSLKYSILITLSVTGVFLAFGYIYSLIEKRNSLYIYSTFGSKGILFTGVIGTTVHEIGHLIMCLIFHHKVGDFQLFNFKGYKHEETLGYVSHRYNDRSLYEKAGNFFIGIGPMISGTLFIIFSFKLLLPSIYESINISSYFTHLSTVNIENTIFLLLSLSKNLLISIFNMNNLSSINFYIFIYLMFCVSSHISLSKKDFENSSVGILSLFLIFFAVCLISILLNLNLNYLLLIFMNIIIYIIFFLALGLVFSLVSLFISYFIYNIKR